MRDAFIFHYKKEHEQNLHNVSSPEHFTFVQFSENGTTKSKNNTTSPHSDRKSKDFNRSISDSSFDIDDFKCLSASSPKSKLKNPIKTPKKILESSSSPFKTPAKVNKPQEKEKVIQQSQNSNFEIHHGPVDCLIGNYQKKSAKKFALHFETVHINTPLEDIRVKTDSGDILDVSQSVHLCIEVWGR